MITEPKHGFKPATSAIRMLAADAVERAKSGHPGMPMGMAELAYVLWTRHLKHNPNNPDWADRDRFVLSNGHGSMLIYALLHLTGYDLSIDDIKSFRQLHSKTPGHPEYGYTPGVETTTGPLGQGIANAVGMAIAEKTLAAQYNTGKYKVVDHHTYCFLGDGCLMEGISHEVCSLAGTLKLGKLIAIYDDNGISIDGEVEGWFTDNTKRRFESYGWQVIDGVDGHDEVAIDNAINAAKLNTEQPTLIMAKTVIGLGAPNKQGTHNVHGAPLGEEELAATRENLGWSYEPFEIPEEVYGAWRYTEAGAQLESAWQDSWQLYEEAYPDKAAELHRRLSGKLSPDYQHAAQALPYDMQAGGEKIASRKASQNCLNVFGPAIPELLGGSADLAGSNLTIWNESVSIEDDPAGNYIHYGVREFGMVAIANGVILHGGFLPYTATFLIFTDYARNAIRMSALMKLRQIYVMTHDSIGLGEDGSTHQPIEQLASLRLIPNLDVWRPCDTTETAVAWTQSIQREAGPSLLALSRQGLPMQAREQETIAKITKGGYVLGAVEDPQVVLMATGSEVDLIRQAAETLATQGVRAQVVSMPCVEAFHRQDESYQAEVLPLHVPRVAVEAGSTMCWQALVGLTGKVIGLDHFGESAPANVLFETFGITADAIVDAAQSLL